MENIPLDQLLDICSFALKVDLKVNSRKRRVVLGRYIFYVLAKKYTTHTLVSIGKMVGRDHATVLHGIEFYNEHKNDRDVFPLMSLCLQNIPDEPLKSLLIKNREIEFLKNRMKQLEYKNAYLSNKLFIRQSENDGFINDLIDMPTEFVEEFVNTRWQPFKRMLASRKTYPILNGNQINT